MRMIKNTKQHIIKLGMLTLFLVGLYLYIYNNYIESAYKEREEIFVINNTIEQSLMKNIEKDDVIVQSFKAPIKDVSGLSIRFATYSQTNSGVFEIIITNKTKRIELYNQKLDISTLIDNEFKKMILKKIDNDKNDIIEMKINVIELDPSSNITIWASQKNIYLNEKLVINDNKVDNDILLKVMGEENKFLLMVYNLISIIILFSLYFLYYSIFVKKIKIESVYLFSSIIVGTIYMFVLPPGTVPDEFSHLNTTYLYANDILGRGSPDEPGLEYIRNEDKNVISQLVPTPTVKTYKFIYDGIFEKTKSNELTTFTAHKILNIPYLYLPGAIGIAIGTLLSFGGIPMLFLGRFFVMLTFVMLTYFAMKKLPFGKVTLFIIAMFPLTIQQASSFSYDAIINGLAFMLIAYSLHITFTDKEISLKDKIIFVVISALLVACKGGAYIPMFLLVFLIPFNKFKNKKKYSMFLFITLLTAVVFYIVFNVLQVSYTDSSGAGGYSLSYLLNHPIRTINIFVKTIFVYGDFYFGSMIGSALGWLNIPVMNIVIVMFAVLTVLSSFKKKDETILFSNRNKILLAFIIISTYMIIELSMLLFWTGFGTDYIDGVQGRYFIPLLLLPCFLLRSNTIVADKKIDGILIYIAIILHVFALCNIISTIL